MRRVAFLGWLCLVGCAMPALQGRFSSVPQEKAITGAPPLEHLGAIAFLGFDWTVDGTPIGTDSLIVYASSGGGWVAHTRSLEGKERSESWLEVNSHWRPVQGWEVRQGDSSGCTTRFVVRGDTLWLQEASLDSAGRDATRGHADQDSFQVPAAFGVDFLGPAAWGYRAAAAQEIGYGHIPVIGFGACDGGATGPRGVKFAWGNASQVAPGASVRPELPRWVRPTGWGLAGRDSLARMIHGAIGAGTVYVDVATGLGLGARVGSDTSTSPPGPTDEHVRLLTIRSGWFVLPSFPPEP